MKYIMPKINYIGAGCLWSGLESVVDLECKKILIVTDAFMNKKTQIVEKIINYFKKIKIEAFVYDGVLPNPSVELVKAALDLYNQEKCDGIVALGGGSAQDCSKMVALLKTNGGKVSDYHGVDLSTKVCAPLICINTTAGTASEVTKNAVISDHVANIKMVIVDKNITPWVSINDPELMVTMPKNLTACTGWDALTHAIECLLTKGADILTDMCACSAISLVIDNLECAINDGKNLKIRENMVYGEFIAGMGFNSAGLGLVHAMSHQLTSEYQIPHGLANAMLLPYILRFNLKNESKKINLLCNALHIDNNGDVDTLIKSCFTKLKNLQKTTNLLELFSFNINPNDFDKLANQALKDVCITGNPVLPDKHTIIGLYREALIELA